jgi:hypothetical protein
MSDEVVEEPTIRDTLLYLAESTSVMLKISSKSVLDILEDTRGVTIETFKLFTKTKRLIT